MKNIFTNQRGVVLMAATGIMLALTVLGLSFLMLGSQESELVHDQLKRGQAFYIAEAGLEKAYWRLKNTDVLDVDSEYDYSTDDMTISLNKDTVGTDMGAIKIGLTSKGSVKDTHRTIDVNLSRRLPGSLGHDIAIGAGGDIYYVDEGGSWPWEYDYWYHSHRRHRFDAGVGDVAEVYGDCETGENVVLPPGLFDSLNAFSTYFANRDFSQYYGDQIFSPSYITARMVFVEGNVVIRDDWSNKNVTIVSTGNIILDVYAPGGPGTYHYVTTGSTGRLTLIAWGNVTIEGNIGDTIINGVICAGGNVELKGFDEDSYGRWCGQGLPAGSGGIFNGTMVAKGDVKLGLDWTVKYYDEEYAVDETKVVNGTLVDPSYELPYGLKSALTHIIWQEKV